MPETIAVKPYSYTPTLTLADRLIRRSKYETTYVPQILVPTEITGYVEGERIRFTLTYNQPHGVPVKMPTRSSDIEITTDKETGLILSISVRFNAFDYSSLVKSYNIATEEVGRLSGSLKWDSARKSYQFVIQLIEIVRSQMEQDKETIQRLFDNAKKAAILGSQQ